MAGWGLASCKEEEQDQEEPKIVNMEDWTARTEAPTMSLKQSSVSDWIGGAEPPSRSEGWKIEAEVKKVRKRGKLTKAEVKKMKATHVDIGTLLKNEKARNND